MGALTQDLLPTQTEINTQFDTPTNRGQSLGLLNELLHAGNGKYKLGTLTAKYYNLSEEEKTTWLNDIDANYQPEVQDFIKSCIITAMKHQQKDADDPLKITLTWSGGTQKKVTCTYDPVGRSYDIQIVGFKAPPQSSLAERRRKKQ